jgi:hypothetical protein
MRPTGFRICSALLILLFAKSSALAVTQAPGSLFGLSGRAGPGLDVRSINPATGATGVLGSMPSITTNSAEYTFDGNGRYYLIGGTNADSTRRLLTIDTTTGLIGNPAIDFQDTNYLAFRNDGALFGLSGRTGPGLDVRSINPATGVTSIVGSIPSITLNSSEYVFDRNAGRYYLIGGTNGDNTLRLLTISATTGSLISDPVLDFPDTHQLAVRNDGVVVALSGRAGPGLDVRTVNPATGVTTIVGSMPTITGASGDYTFDGVARRYYLAGLINSDPQMRLLTISTDSATILSSPQLDYADTHYFAVVVPEPSTLALAGLVFPARHRRRRWRKNRA